MRSSLRSEVLSVLAGAAFLVLGAVAAGQAQRRYSLIAAGAGIAWLAADVSPALLLLHRPLVLHAALALPTGRVGSYSARCLLALAWTGAVFTPLGRHPLWMLLLGALVAAEAVRRRSRLELTAGGTALTAIPALTLLAATLALPGAVRLGRAEAVVGLPVAALYEALTLCTGLALLFALVLRASMRETDFVLELSHGTGTQTAMALRRAAAARMDPSGRQSLTAAAEMLEAHDALHADLAAKVEQVRALRRRLVEAVVAERRRLEGGMAGAVRYLHELSETLQELEDDPSSTASRRACQREVALSLEDLRLLAEGLHPRMLTERGLGPALRELAAHCPVPTRVHSPPARIEPSVESAVWYACSEAMANVAKHADASHVSIEVRVDGAEVLACVRDDGIGGAQVRPGGGLAGLADRLSALGGHLDVQSVPGSGTSLQIRVPLC